MAKLEPSNEQFSQKVRYYNSQLDKKKNRSKLCNTTRESDAYLYAKEAVKLQLNAPRTAKFGSLGQTDIKLYKECVFIVRGYVDAQNVFGALIRKPYEVRLSVKDGYWALLKVDI